MYIMISFEEYKDILINAKTHNIEIDNITILNSNKMKAVMKHNYLKISLPKDYITVNQNNENVLNTNISIYRYELYDSYIYDTYTPVNIIKDRILISKIINQYSDNYIELVEKSFEIDKYISFNFDDIRSTVILYNDSYFIDIIEYENLRPTIEDYNLFTCVHQYPDIKNTKSLFKIIAIISKYITLMNIVEIIMSYLTIST